MTDTSKDRLNQLESRIENMLDKLIEIDEEEIENNQDQSSLKFSEDNSSSDEDKNEKKISEKDIFFYQFLQNEDNSEIKGITISKKPSFDSSQMNLNQNTSPNLNLIYNNNYPYNSYNFNYIYPQQIDTQSQNKNNFFGIPNNSYNNKNMNQINNETLSTTASLLSNMDNNNYMFMNNNNSYINYGYQNFNSSFINDNNKFPFKRNKKYHKSFFAGDKICFNKKFSNLNNNYINNAFCNTNVELEILLIEINKILNKTEKIDQLFFNKLKGKFEQIIRTHKGSRIFQHYLKNTHTDILHQIFLEIKQNLTELLKDNYANYFCKKFFDCLNQKDRIEYLSIIQNDLKNLAIDITATYPIQGIIEQLGSKADKKIIYLGIKDSIMTFCYNVYGTHVLEKILSYFEDEFTKEIIDYIYYNFIDLAYNMNGICVVKKLLLMTHKKDLHQKLKKIVINNALNLIVHQYGNYVIQVIFENWDDNELEDILSQYKNKFISLSKLKYSSNAIERIIEKNQNNLEFYINEICKENNLCELMLNNYGNYVIQKSIKLSSGNSRERLIENILKNLYIIEDKKIINKWKMIISSKFNVN